MFKSIQLATIVAAIFAVTASGSPVDITPVEPLKAIKRASENRCGDSDFVNQTSGASPPVSDCRVLINNISGGGTWTTPAFGQQRELASFGQCKFGVQSVGSSPEFEPSFVVGNQDIIDLINDSINRFQSPDGRVGSKGTMQCGFTFVEWGLY